MLMALLAAGCGGAPGEDIQVASISSFAIDSFGHIAAVAGISGGDGRLVVVDPTGAGFLCEFDVSAVGLGVDVGGYALEGFGVDFFESISMDIDGAEGGLTADQLLGTYTGSHGGAQIGLGIASHSLENRAGVKITITNSAVGVGVNAGLEALSLHSCEFARR